MLGIIVCNRSQLYQETTKLNDYPTLIISITTHDNTWPTAMIGPNTLQHIRLKFDDVNEDCDNYRAITEADAQIIYNAYLSCKSKALYTIVNCDAGISRSAGVASALAYLEFNKDTLYTSISGSAPHPNRTVFNKILTAAGLHYVKY